jgi:hydrogenase expression/formation protein HypC
MCLATRGKIIEFNGTAGMRMAKVDFGGITRQACVEYLPEADIAGIT